MRLIGHLKNEASANTFSGYLTSLDIHNQVESDNEGWAVWIHSEDLIDAGQKALAEYLQNPADRKYQQASQVAETKERQRLREEQKAAKRIHDREKILSRSNHAPLTITLIGLCVVVTLAIGWDPGFSDIRWLVISQFPPSYPLVEVRAGQWWRLITPIFIHFGPMHLIFNMWWLYDLGLMIEKRQGLVKLALLVVVIGVLSNIAQYWMFGPAFGGMSGVLYGLLGYIWLRGQCDPASGLGLSSMTVGMMLVWMFLCLFDNYLHIIGNVANATHVAGLIIGIVWGAAPMAKNLI